MPLSPLRLSERPLATATARESVYVFRPMVQSDLEVAEALINLYPWLRNDQLGYVIALMSIAIISPDIGERDLDRIVYLRNLPDLVLEKLFVALQEVYS